MPPAPERERRLVHVPCPLCGARAARPFAWERGLRVCTCRDCGLLYVSPRLSTEDLHRLYEDYYHRPGHWRDYLADHALPQDGRKQAGDADRLWTRRYQALWPAMERALGQRRPVRALDLGAGQGRWARWLAERGVESWAYEVADNPALAAARTHGVHVAIAPTPEAARLPGQGFDLVTLWDVIEHLEAPGETLARVRGLLASDGVLFVQTPNARWIRWKVRAARLLPRRLVGELVSPYGILLPEQHLQYYTVRTLRRQLRAAGYAPLSWPAIDWSEPGTGRLSRWAYRLAWGQAALVRACTRGRVCTNIGLSVLARPSP